VGKQLNLAINTCTLCGYIVAIYLYPEPVNITLLDVASGAIADSVQYIPVQPVFVHLLLGLFVR